MKNKIECAIIIIVIVAIGIIAPQLLIKSANAQIPFGGPAILISACNGGFLYFVGPPAPPPNLYFFVIPPFGFNVLGWALPAAVPCIVGIAPVGYGLPVILFGSG